MNNVIMYLLQDVTELQSQSNNAVKVVPTKAQTTTSFIKGGKNLPQEKCETATKGRNFRTQIKCTIQPKLSETLE